MTSSIPANGSSSAIDSSATTNSNLLFSSVVKSTNQIPLTSPSPTTTTEPQEDLSPSHVTTYVFVPIGSIILVLLIAGLVIFLVRKSRLDKLRHHLMPLYNFDPAEEGEDWESELLEEGMDHRIAAHMKMRVETPSPNDEPKLAFNHDSGL